MNQQMTLWPEVQRRSQRTNLLEDLAPETQNAVTAILAKLISKAACPTQQEDSNER
jgi:hypothetical protein